MSMIFLKLVNMSLAAGWLILAVIVLRLFLRRAPRWICCVLWGIVAVRLVCPFSPESPFSLIPSAETISPDAVRYAQQPGIRSQTNPGADRGIPGMDNAPGTGADSGIPIIYNEPNPRDTTSVPAADNGTDMGLSGADNVVGGRSTPAINSGIFSIDSTLALMIDEAFSPAPGGSVNPLYVWTFAGSILWIIGLTAMLGYACFSYLRLRRRVREAVRLRDHIWLCDAVRSPFILGVVRPKIYLSSDTDQSRMGYILAHEEAHLGRRDHWWKLLGYLLLAVYWFQPLVWAAYILLCRDIELACDERVIRDMDMRGKKSYSDALVACSLQRRMAAACPLAFGEIGVKERVRTILNYRKPAFWAIIAAVCVCAAVALCFLTNPRRDTFDIRIVIPANSGRTVSFSEEEISPCRNSVTLQAGEGLGDTSVILKPTEITREDAYDEFTYMTPGLPVKLYAEKGGWFRVGVTAENPTDKDMVVYVRVKGVLVRIADYAEADGGNAGAASNSGADGENAGMASAPGAGGGNAGAASALGTDGENAGAASAPGTADGGNAGTASSPGAQSGNIDEDSSTITFIGIIRPHILNSSSAKPIILVEPIGDELSYESVCFVLPVEEAEWASRENSMVSITCRDAFEETQPPFGELISIEAVSTSPYMGITGVGALPRLQGDELAAVTAAILDANKTSYPEDYDFECCDFIPLEILSATPLLGSTTHLVTYYGWALYERYNISDSGIEELGGSHIPLALTFTLDENGYVLEEYWQPRDGSYYVPDIRDKFPAHIAEDGIDSQKFGLEQIQSCCKQAILAYGLDTDSIVENLLNTICSSPAASSSPQDYIDAHDSEYRELMRYGEYTLRYCFARFRQGGETGLEGRIMALACEEILQTRGQIPTDADTAGTGQFWYDTLYTHGSNNVIPYLE